MALFKIAKGQSATLPSTAIEGYCYFAEDTGKFYIDVASGDVASNPEIRKSINAEETDRLKNALTIKANASDVDSLIFDGSESKTLVISDYVANNFLPIAGGTMIGPLSFTEGVGYGDALPQSANEGQIFFLDTQILGTRAFVPAGGTAGQVLTLPSSGSGIPAWETFSASEQSIEDSAVITNKLADNAVTAAKLATGSVTRDKMAQETLYSPVLALSEAGTTALTETGIGATYRSDLDISGNLEISQVNSTNLPIGAELAVFRFGSLDTQMVAVTFTNTRFVIPGEALIHSNQMVKILDPYDMIAVKKIASDSENGDLWLVTGNIEVVE